MRDIGEDIAWIHCTLEVWYKGRVYAGDLLARNHDVGIIKGSCYLNYETACNV